MIDYKDENEYKYFKNEIDSLIKRKELGLMHSIQFERELISLFEQGIPEIVLHPNIDFRDLYPRYQLIEDVEPYVGMIDVNDVLGTNVSSQRERI